MQRRPLRGRTYNGGVRGRRGQYGARGGRGGGGSGDFLIPGILGLLIIGVGILFLFLGPQDIGDQSEDGKLFKLISIGIWILGGLCCLLTIILAICKSMTKSDGDNEL